jgi:hypothetical protein
MYSSCDGVRDSFRVLIFFRKAWVAAINRRRFASISSRLIGVLLASTERTVRDLTEKYEHRGG